MKIPTRIASAIINSLKGGVVPRIGLPYITVGRETEINALLHDAADYVLGRMGVPYRERGISLISVALDAPQDVISALSGRIGSLPGVSVKTAYSNIVTAE